MGALETTANGFFPPNISPLIFIIQLILSIHELWQFSEIKTAFIDIYQSNNDDLNGINLGSQSVSLE